MLPCADIGEVEEFFTPRITRPCPRKNAVVLVDSKGDVAQAVKILHGAMKRAADDDPSPKEAQNFLTELNEQDKDTCRYSHCPSEVRPKLGYTLNRNSTTFRHGEPSATTSTHSCAEERSTPGLPRPSLSLTASTTKSWRSRRFCSAIARVASYAATPTCHPDGRPQARIDSSTASMDRWTDPVRAATISAMLVFPTPGEAGEHDEAIGHATASGVIAATFSRRTRRSRRNS